MESPTHGSMASKSTYIADEPRVEIPAPLSVAERIQRIEQSASAERSDTQPASLSSGTEQVATCAEENLPHGSMAHKTHLTADEPRENSPSGQVEAGSVVTGCTQLLGGARVSTPSQNVEEEDDLSINNVTRRSKRRTTL